MNDLVITFPLVHMKHSFVFFVRRTTMVCTASDCIAPNAQVGDTVNYTHAFDQWITVSNCGSCSSLTSVYCEYFIFFCQLLDHTKLIDAITSAVIKIT